MRNNRLRQHLPQVNQVEFGSLEGALMQLPEWTRLLRLQGRPMILDCKIRYYADPEFNGLFAQQPE